MHRYMHTRTREQLSLDFEKQFHSQLYEIESRVTFASDDQRERTVTLSTLQLALRQ